MSGLGWFGIQERGGNFDPLGKDTITETTRKGKATRTTVIRMHGRPQKFRELIADSSKISDAGYKNQQNGF